MRIQHNIMAMNAFRNYNTNTNALGRNLEKLSSGYKINRAGDDAAGLAISEKMRAQISGLKQAQSNVKDGISLVKTAEGALQEVQDMMNRMVTLATQSANGTYDNNVDRANLQKEVEALKSEIDRIADSSNFNGTKLLDGSLSAEGSAAKTGTIVADLSKFGIDLVANADTVNAEKGVYQTKNEVAADITLDKFGKGKDSVSFTINYTDADGKEQSVTKTLFLSTDTNDKKLYLDDGSENGLKLNSGVNAHGTITTEELATAMKEVLNKDNNIKANFTVDTADAAGTGDALKFTAKATGSDGAVLNSIEVSSFDYDTKDTTPSYGITKFANVVDTKTEAIDTTKAYDFATDAKVWDNTKLDTDTTATTEKKLADAVFEINGKKFVFLKGTNPTDEELAEMKNAGIEHYVAVGGAAVNNTALKSMIEKIELATGLDLEQGTYTAGANNNWAASATGTSVIIKDGSTTVDGLKGGLTLQIGDTAEDYNQIDVSVQDMHVKSLGIGDLDISKQEDAQQAIDKIRDAINTVSSTRGDLGAIQNRLEHTTKNLAVMTENIQDAESTIRDVDIADEMTSYTKNNILLQSAQAMLAQANQMPQGVLQLLQ